MTKVQLRWMISLMTLAALAVVGLQAYIWRQSLDEAREQFDLRVQAAMVSVYNLMSNPEGTVVIAIGSDRDGPEVRRDSLASYVIQKNTVRFEASEGDAATFLGPEQHIEVRRILLDSLRHEVTTRFEAARDSLRVVDSDPAAGPDDRKKAVQTLMAITSEGLSNVLGATPTPRDELEPVLTAQFSQNNLPEDFDWGIYDQRNDTWSTIMGDTTAVQASTRRFPLIHLGSGEFLSLQQGSSEVTREYAPQMLALHFPNESWRMAREVVRPLVASGLLALLVIGCLGYALYLIVRQKRLAEVKTDFINNMTHEFKTPISTISLACEALQDESVRHTPDLQTRYTAMIASENSRLATQVEKVLQMALLDRGDLGLKMEPVDLHTIVREIEGAFAMQVSQRGGQLTSELGATPAVVTADGLHLRQMLTNLLDNANKYSPESPTIHIATRNRESGVEIAVRDHGIGIQRDALRKVFDRFYRVPTGNRHDVKGFGLGLAYVHTMALAHGGQVSATSTPGRGSTFTLYLPYAHA
ncbi:MAG: HAMP domain-containing sensor histidine kinase [Bacteroidota bacterium]